jgi:hypothetical protein
MTAARKPGDPRADFGKPIDTFLAKQPVPLRAILEALRKLIEQTAPSAEPSIKWGMPFFTVGGKMMCALGATKSHVTLVLVGPPGRFPDPEGRLEGKGKGGRHLKVRSLDELPKEQVRKWLRIAIKHAQG